MLATKYTGGCQCGDIRYEVLGTPRKLVVCHCTDCQRQSGSAFGMTLVVDEADFRLTRGEPKSFASKSDAGRAKLGVFCPRCGTRIYHKPEWRRGTVSVKPGTLDDTSWLKPDMHLWIRSKQLWITIPEGVETHEAQPS
ncbi:MAG: GFA family protein [Acidiferrobacterales bacterium]|nr:GFA family protein [Acidiferrobacterales bacterium]